LPFILLVNAFLSLADNLAYSSGSLKIKWSSFLEEEGVFSVIATPHLAASLF